MISFKITYSKKFYPIARKIYKIDKIQIYEIHYFLSIYLFDFKYIYLYKNISMLKIRIMEILNVNNYYSEENGLEKVLTPQFYLFMSDVCKE